MLALSFQILQHFSGYKWPASRSLSKGPTFTVTLHVPFLWALQETFFDLFLFGGNKISYQQMRHSSQGTSPPPHLSRKAPYSSSERFLNARLPLHFLSIFSGPHGLWEQLFRKPLSALMEPTCSITFSTKWLFSSCSFIWLLFYLRHVY